VSAEKIICITCDVCGSEEYFHIGSINAARNDAKYNFGWITALRPTTKIPTTGDSARADVCNRCTDEVKAPDHEH